MAGFIPKWHDAPDLDQLDQERVKNQQLFLEQERLFHTGGGLWVLDNRAKNVELEILLRSFSYMDYCVRIATTLETRQKKLSEIEMAEAANLHIEECSMIVSEVLNDIVDSSVDQALFRKAKDVVNSMVHLVHENGGEIDNSTSLENDSDGYIDQPLNNVPSPNSNIDSSSSNNNSKKKKYKTNHSPQQRMPSRQIISMNATPKSKNDDKTSSGCTCVKSACLKFYCKCFAEGGYCSPGCQCKNCRNTPENESLRTSAMKLIKERKPNAFRKDRSKRSCACKKTQCLKLYCDCFSANRYCQLLCKCEGCSNFENSTALAAVLKETKQDAFRGSSNWTTLSLPYQHPHSVSALSNKSEKKVGKRIREQKRGLTTVPRQQLLKKVKTELRASNISNSKNNGLAAISQLAEIALRTEFQ